MKNVLFLLPLLALGACGSSASETVKKVEDMAVSVSSDLKDGKPITAAATDPGKFTSIATNGPDDVIFKTADAYSVSATGSASVLEKLRFTLVDGQLKVGRYQSKWSDDEKAVITITAPSITAIAAAGSGDVKADRVTGDKVDVSAAGSGSIDVASIETATLSSDIAGSGNVTLGGKADSADYSIAGSGNVDAIKLQSSKASISIAGSGSLDLTASSTVDASIAGSGNVNVTGGAKCTSSVVGSGKLNCR
jgi:PBP1b-binding outer membrane lipoprotein LpoB